MNIETNLLGRLRNTKLPKSKGLAPLFEALVNSIHGLEDADFSSDQGLIRIFIEREDSNQIDISSDDPVSGRSVNGDIVGFRVVDNGIGFNEANFNSFKTLDSDYKIEKGGRGIGRLLWLKAFDRVEVNSCFLNDNDEMEQRTFSFSRDGIEDHDTKDAHRNAKRETVVRLVDFNQDYRTRKTGDAIAKSMVEHCL